MRRSWFDADEVPDKSESPFDLLFTHEGGTEAAELVTRSLTIVLQSEEGVADSLGHIRIVLKGGEPLVVVPLLKETTGPRLAYRITFGVRPGEDDWKRELNALIAKLQGKLDAVLLQYGVPLLDEQDHPITQPR